FQIQDSKFQIPDSKFQIKILCNTNIEQRTTNNAYQPSTINHQLLYNFLLFFLGLYYSIMRDYQMTTIQGIERYFNIFAFNLLALNVLHVD
ncbi:MAG TPA: hypothetical protein DDY04_06065, partial [Bacteroidales bacterium]|nr:hypothetical protein [Bacteroidales bacterium]